MCRQMSAFARLLATERSKYLTVKAEHSRDIIRCRSGGHVTGGRVAHRPLHLELVM